MHNIPTIGKEDSKRKRSARRRYAPLHGRDFDITLRDLDNYKTSRTRDHIAYVLLAAALAAMLMATVCGLHVGNFSALKDVWAAAGPFIGGVAGYYFHRSRKDSG